MSSLYRGVTATLVGAGPRGAVGFGIYETMKPALHAPPSVFADNPALATFLCGYLAGFASEFLIYPLDTVRRRQQALGDASRFGRDSVWRAVTNIAQEEGFRGLYKGITLNLLKSPIATAVSFMVNDSVKETMGYRSGENLGGPEER